MASITFDTLQFVETLERANIPREQAQAQAQALRHVLDTALADQSSKQAETSDRAIAVLDTKTERAVLTLETKLENEIALVRKDMNIGFAEIRGEQKLIRWMLGFVLTGVLALVLKTFF